MITIFTAPKAFEGEFDRIQRNAIKSWLLLDKDIEVILFGKEEGVEDIAREFNLLYIPDVQKNEYGTPLINDIFEKAQEAASNNILSYINADIITLSNFTEAVKKINLPEFLMVGHRWNLDIQDSVDLDDKNWEARLIPKIKQHCISAIDYFVFPRGFYKNIPPLAIGRFSWDNWLIYYAKANKKPVIDVTDLATVVHQNHSYPKRKDVSFEIEKKKNLEIIGGYSNMFTLREADLLLKKEGLVKPPFPRRLFSELAMFYPWKVFLGVKRKIIS